MSKALIFISLLALVVLAGVFAAHLRGRAAEAANPAVGEIVKGVHIVTMGPADAPPVVLIHGASGSTYDMSFRLAPALAARYRVYIVDRPGFGHSAPLPRADETSVAAQARTIRAAVASLEPRTPIVAGQSYGGAVALAWALEMPETLGGLALISAPSHVWEGGNPALYEALATPVIGPLLAYAIAAFTPAAVIDDRLGGVFAPQPVPEGYTEHFAVDMSLRPRTHLLNARQRTALKPQIAEMVARYPSLSLPIESIHGTADVIVPHTIHALPLFAEVPQNVLTLLDGVGHMPHHTETDSVVARIDRIHARIALR